MTKDFCEWVASLGGDSSNIEESTITSLFASGYETKPALSVPIHVVELTNVPPELRVSASVPPQSSSGQPTLVDHKRKSTLPQKNWVNMGCEMNWGEGVWTIDIWDLLWGGGS